MKLHRRFAVFFVGTFAVSASADKLELKPGLWEIDSQMASASGEIEAAMAQMQQQLANMPPEQRKMMEEMMGKHGVKMGGDGPFELGGQVCMTKEMVELDEIPVQQGDCTTTSKSRSGNAVKMTFTCTDPPASGEGQFTIESPEVYKTKMIIRTTAQGRNETMNMDATGKWLGADCGNVKPPRPPTAK